MAARLNETNSYDFKTLQSFVRCVRVQCHKIRDKFCYATPWHDPTVSNIEKGCPFETAYNKCLI